MKTFSNFYSLLKNLKNVSIQNEWAHAWWNVMWNEFGKNYFILFMETWLVVQCVDDACEMVCPTYYQCMQSWRWCMWNDVLPLITSAFNHDMERLKKFLSNLNNLFFFFFIPGLFFHNFYWPNTKSPFILVFSFFWFSDRKSVV